MTSRRPDSADTPRRADGSRPVSSGWRSEDEPRRDRPSSAGTVGGSRVISISWVPIVVSTGPSVRSCPWDFYIGQTVLREVQTRILAKADRALGLLMGKVREPVGNGSAYIVVDQFLPSLESVSEDADVRQVARMLRPLQEAASLAGRTVVGWYRGHADLGLELSEVEERFHADRFPAPWQFALLGIGDMERPVGAVFARNGAGELAPATFHELLESHSILGGGRKRTVLEWRNYGTTDRVVSSDGREIPRPPGTLVAQPGQRPNDPDASDPAAEPDAATEPDAAAEPHPAARRDRPIDSDPEEHSRSAPSPPRGGPSAERREGWSATSASLLVEKEEGGGGAPSPRPAAAESEEEEWSGVVPLVLPHSPEERGPALGLLSRRPGLLPILAVAALLLAGMAWCA